MQAELVREKNGLRYLGWSSVAIQSRDHGDLVFDPFFDNRYDTYWSDISDYDNVKVICISHGHWEHYADAPKVANRTGAKIVTSPKLCRHLAKYHKVPEAQLVPITTGETLTVEGFEISEFGWYHRNINYFKFFGGNVKTGIDFVMQNLRHTPFDSPMSGFVVKTPEGLTVLNLTEGMNGLMPQDELEALGKRYRPDVLLGGWQLEYVDAVAECVQHIGASTCVLYHPHSALFELMNMPSRPIETFCQRIAELSPGVEILTPQPRERLAL